MINTIKKYKKTFLLILFYLSTTVITTFLYKHGSIDHTRIQDIIASIGFFGFIILGMLYSQGITGPIAASIFALYSGSMPHWWIALLGGIGTGIIDIFMYEVFKYEIHDELTNLKDTKLFKTLGKYKFFRDKLLMTFLGFLIIASPLSDDMGTILIEEEGVLKTKYFFLIDMLLNMAGIYFFLNI
jgi:hypothetical protein